MNITNHLKLLNIDTQLQEVPNLLEMINQTYIKKIGKHHSEIAHITLDQLNINLITRIQTGLKARSLLYHNLMETTSTVESTKNICFQKHHPTHLKIATLVCKSNQTLEKKVDKLFLTILKISLRKQLLIIFMIIQVDRESSTLFIHKILFNGKQEVSQVLKIIQE